MSVDKKKWVWLKKIEYEQKRVSVLSMSVSVECGVWSVEYDSAAPA